MRGYGKRVLARYLYQNIHSQLRNLCHVLHDVPIQIENISRKLASHITDENKELLNVSLIPHYYINIRD